MKKIFTLLIGAAFFMNLSAQSILVIHAGPANNDQQIIDALTANNDFTVTHTTLTAYTAGDEDAYEVVLLTETPGSGDLTPIYPGLYDNPVVSLKAYLYKNTATDFDPPWLVSDETFFASSASADLGENADPETVTETKILESDITADIFAGVGAADDIFSFASGNVEGGDNGGHWQVMDFESSAVSEISNNAIPLAESEYANTELAGQFDFTTIMAAIEANSISERTVVLGIHSQYELSDECLQVIENSIYWTTGTDNPNVSTSVQSVEASNFSVYPNPVKNVLNISNASEIANVEIYGVAGQMVLSQVNEGANTLRVNTADLANGVYVVRINTVDGQSYSDKLVK